MPIALRFGFLHVENFIRPLIKARRDNPRSGEDAEKDLITVILDATEIDGSPIADEVVEVRIILVHGLHGLYRKKEREEVSACTARRCTSSYVDKNVIKLCCACAHGDTP